MLVQRSLLDPDLEWQVSLTKDSVDPGLPVCDSAGVKPGGACFNAGSARAKLMSNTGDDTGRFEFGDGIVADFDQFELTVGDTTHTLTTMEMQLLKYFIEQERRVLSRDQIMENVWEDTAAFSTRSIDNFVMRLRRLIEPLPSEPRHILSVRGTGYRFVANPEPGEEGSDSENLSDSSEK